MNKPLCIKICLLFFVVLGVSLLFGRLIGNQIILPAYSQLEKELAHKDIKRSFQAVESKIEHLKEITHTWAHRDDVYEFLHNRKADSRNPDQLLEIITQQASIDIFFLLSDKKEIIINSVYDRDKKFEISLPAFSAESFVHSDLFHQLLKMNEKEAAGIFLTSKGIVLVSASSVFPAHSKKSSKGVMVMGRFLDQTIIKQLRERTQLSFFITTPNFTTFSDAQLNKLLSDDGLVLPSDDNSYITGQKAMLDIFNNPVLIIKTQNPRSFYKQGQRVSFYTSLIIALSLSSITLVTALFYCVFQNRKDKQTEQYQRLIAEKNDEISLSTAQLNALSEAATEALMLVEDNYCIDMNSHTQEIFGYTLDEIYRHPTSELVIPEERERVGKLIEDFHEGFYETIGLRKDNSTFPLLVHGKVIKLGNRNLRAVAIKDLTKQRQKEAERQILEDKVQRSERMESIGMLAGSVAHDLNNILSGVVTYPEFLLLKMKEDDPLRKPIEEIKKSGKKAAEVVEDLLTVARGIALQKNPVNLNNLIEAYLQSTEFTTICDDHPNITIQAEIKNDVPNIAGSPIHINKVIMNLLTNAIEAIGEKSEGFVTISTKMDTVHIDNIDLKAGNYVSIEIKDNGTGISKGDLEHIFEPFYSRKIKGRSGTGLGLAIVWNVMQDHNGTVSVNSDKEGTSFTLSFPVTEKHLEETDESLDISSIQGQQQTILVVDDNQQQLEIAKQILMTLNYTAYTANSGEEALNFLKDNRVDLLVLDMIMEPGLSGLETYNFAINLQQDIKAIVTSGFSVSEEVEKLETQGAGTFLRKPYSILQIGNAIQSVLQKK